MTTHMMGLDLRVFTLPLLAELSRAGLIADEDVIRIATARENAGYNVFATEHEISFLLQEQGEQVRALLGGVDSGRLSLDDERALLWIKLHAVRSQIYRIGDYQFEFEELLDDFDHSGEYAGMRFFADRSGAGESYLERVDSTLESVREGINAIASRRL